MTELQIGLIGLGAVAVSGVVVYNTWLEYRHRKLAQDLLEPGQDDVLLGHPVGVAEPIEPRSDDAVEAAQDHGQTSAEEEPSEEDPVVSGRPAGTTRAMRGALESKWPEVHPDERLEPMLEPAVFADERIEPVLHNEQVAERDVIAPPAFVEQEVSAVEAPAPVAEEEVSVPGVAHVEPPAPPAVTPFRTARGAVPEAQARASEPVGDDYREIAEPQHLLSADIDYIAAFEAVEPTSAAQILSASQRALARVRKPIHWFGYNEVTREWETIEATSTVDYRSLRVG